MAALSNLTLEPNRRTFIAVARRDAYWLFPLPLLSSRSQSYCLCDLFFFPHQWVPGSPEQDPGHFCTGSASSRRLLSVSHSHGVRAGEWLPAFPFSSFLLLNMLLRCLTPISSIKYLLSEYVFTVRLCTRCEGDKINETEPLCQAIPTWVPKGKIDDAANGCSWGTAA